MASALPSTLFGLQPEWVPNDRPARPRCGGSQGQEQGLPAALRRSLVTQNQAAALRRLFTACAAAGCPSTPAARITRCSPSPPSVRRSLSFATKPPLETPPPKSPLFPPLWVLLSVPALASWVPRSPQTRSQGPSLRAGCTASEPGMITLGYFIFRGAGVAFSIHIFY